MAADRFTLSAEEIGWAREMALYLAHDPAAPVESDSSVHPRGIADDDRTLFPDPVDRTAVRMETVRRLIALHLQERGVIPERLEDAYPAGPETDWGIDYRHDAWGNHFRYVRAGTDYELRSAGADGRFGTPDDIVATREKGTPWA